MRFEPSSKSDIQKLGRFSHYEVKMVLAAVGLGILLGFAAEKIDSSLPSAYRMKSILNSLMQYKEAPQSSRNGSYDIGRPEVRFPVSEHNDRKR
jgi:hypothetical protein